jgi:hypothetical protein
MQIKLEELLKAIGLPVGLAVVIAALAGYFVVPMEQAFQLFGLFAGIPFVIALIINVLKQFGIITDGSAGRWSAGMNLVSIIGLSIALKFFPNFDYVSLDAYIFEIGQALVVIVTFILQLIGTKSAHRAYVYGLGISRFSLSGNRK